MKSISVECEKSERQEQLTVDVRSVLEQEGQTLDAQLLLSRSPKALHNLVRRGPSIPIAMVDSSDGVGRGVEEHLGPFEVAEEGRAGEGVLQGRVACYVGSFWVDAEVEEVAKGFKVFWRDRG